MDDSYDALLATASAPSTTWTRPGRLDAGRTPLRSLRATITEERLAALPTARTCAHHRS